MEIFDKKVEGIRLRWTLIWGTSWAWQTRAVGIPDRLDWFHARMARWRTCQPLPVMASKLCIQLWNVHPSSLGITHLHWLVMLINTLGSLLHFCSTCPKSKHIPTRALDCVQLQVLQCSEDCCRFFWVTKVEFRIFAEVKQLLSSFYYDITSKDFINTTNYRNKLYPEKESSYCIQ